MSPSPILAVEGLSKSYGGVHAVRGVSFAVEAGEIVALIGPNGAGKSTCFNMLNGQIRPDAGRIFIAGRDTAGLAPREIFRLGVGRTFQITATFSSMTVRENVQVALLSHLSRLRVFFTAMRKLHGGQAEDLISLVGLGDEAGRACGELAYGDLKRLELAVALANAPRLLLMDEPTAGMAPAERAALMTLVAGIARERSIGVLFTEHDMDVVFEHAVRVMVLDRGRLIAQGTPAAVRADATVRDVYLGGGLVFEGGTNGGRAVKLDVSRLNSFYGPAHILFDVAIEVAEGEAVALLGRNGAGKSTTFRTLMGLVPERSGRVLFEGADIARLPTYEIARRGLGWVPEDRRIFTELTVEENLEVGARPKRPGVPRWTAESLYALFPNLGPLRRRPGGSMSGGEQQMLTIARTLMGNPSLVLLDEPSEGLAPKLVEEMARAIVAMKREGLSIILSEQNLHFARLIADRAYIIEKGRIRFGGTMAELAVRPEIRDAYLTM